MTENQDERTAARRAGEPENWDQKVVAELMATPQGRYWMERLLDLCGARHPLYNHDGDALGMAWRDGRADIGRYLETQLEQYCPDLYLRMIRERRARIERERAKQAREDARRSGGGDIHNGVTPVEELADLQASAEAQAAAGKPAKPAS